MSRSQQRLWAFTSARLSRLWSSVKSLGRTEIDDEAERAEGQVAEAEDLALSAAGLRGGIAKIAQLRAYLQGAAALGPEAQLVLSRLWDHVPGEAPAAIRRVVEEDLGKPLAELYQSWDEVPLGVQGQPLPDAAVQVDGQRRQPQRRPGQPDRRARPATQRQPPGDGELPVQPGVRQQPAVGLDPDQPVAGLPDVPAGADLERR